jgi:uncharacterized protein
MLITSRYNLCIPLNNIDLLLYNTRTGAVISLADEDAVSLAKQLCDKINCFNCDIIDDDLQKQLLDGGFLIDAQFDELAVIKKRFAYAKENAPPVATIVTSMNCNLACFYCYETRAKCQLAADDLPAILAWIKELTTNISKKDLHVLWYGGEPLLNLDFLTKASFAIQDYCKQQGITYSSSMISNGTLWPEAIADFIAAHAIKYLQITFDGLEATHNKRRCYAPGFGDANGASTFTKALTVVEKAKTHTKILVRFNVDNNNLDELLPFVEFARVRGWFAEPNPVTFYPAMLSGCSEKSCFLTKNEFSVEKYAEIKREIKQILPLQSRTKEYVCPQPQFSICAGLAKHCGIVGADGLFYRCTLHLGNSEQATGSIKDSAVYLQHAEFWQRFDPMTDVVCKNCTFLPLCFGGCPKVKLEQDMRAFQRQCDHWRLNIAQDVAAKCNVKLTKPVIFSEQEQFKSSEVISD